MLITQNKQIDTAKLLRVSFELQTGHSALKTSLQLICIFYKQSLFFPEYKPHLII